MPWDNNPFGGSPGSDSKESACNAGDPGSIPGSGRSPGEGNGSHSNTTLCPERSILLPNTRWAPEHLSHPGLSSLTLCCVHLQPHLLNASLPPAPQFLSLFHWVPWILQSVQFSRSVVSDSLCWWTAACQASLSSPSPRACSNSCPLSWWCHPNILSSVIPSFSSCLLSFPASGSFPLSRLFTSGGQSLGASASASALPMNIQDWFPLGWTGWISLQSEGLSRVFSTPQFKSIDSSVLSFLYGPILTSIHDYWKNYSFDYTDLCWQR